MYSCHHGKKVGGGQDLEVWGESSSLRSRGGATMGSEAKPPHSEVQYQIYAIENPLPGMHHCFCKWLKIQLELLMTICV